MPMMDWMNDDWKNRRYILRLYSRTLMEGRRKTTT